MEDLLPPDLDPDFFKIDTDFVLAEFGFSFTEKDSMQTTSSTNVSDEPMSSTEKQTPEPIQVAVLPPVEPFIDTTEKQTCAPTEDVYLDIQELLDLLDHDPITATPSTKGRLQDDAAFAPTPVEVLPPATSYTVGTGEVYLDQEFLEGLELPLMAASLSPTTVEAHDDHSLVAATTCPPLQPPPVILPEATAPNHGRRPERKKVNRWSKEEHELFLKGMIVHGRGDWESISRDFVKTRSPIQLASHAQKYFLRLKESKDNTTSSRKKRGSIHDMTTDHILKQLKASGSIN